MELTWPNLSNIKNAGARPYTCGWCGNSVTSEHGMYATSRGTKTVVAEMRVCPGCGGVSTLFVDGRQVPAPEYGDKVTDLPDELAGLYRESRQCIGVGAFHAAVLISRKILMHVAVDNGASEGESFVSYVDFLVGEKLIPAKSKAWVDEIREVGNDVNHEIPAISRDEARAVVDFVSMLLKLLYEYPARGERSVNARQGREAPS